jgi:hypothetical protein
MINLSNLSYNRNRFRYNIFIYYTLASLTFCFLYYHRFIQYYDFYLAGNDASPGIYPVLGFKALPDIQMRMLVPFAFEFISIITHLPDKTVYFVLMMLQLYFILYTFYFLLNQYFIDRQFNAILSVTLLYPMLWTYIILNDYFIFNDLATLFFILLGQVFIVKRKNNWLLITFCIGAFNHDSIIFLLVMYLLFNYKRAFKIDTILYSCVMVIIFVSIKSMLSYIFSANAYPVIRFNYMRNFAYFFTIQPYYLIRNVLLIFGGIHLFILFHLKKIWKQMPDERLVICLTIIPYVVAVILRHTIGEIRDYIAVIPFFIVPFLVFMSTFKNSAIKPIHNQSLKN